MEEEKNNVIGGTKNGIGSEIQQEAKHRGFARKGKTTLPQNSSAGVQREVRIKEPPWVEVFRGRWGVFGQIPKVHPAHAKQPGGDTDSIMTEKYTTQEQILRDQQPPTVTKHSITKDEIRTERDPSQQLLNMGQSPKWEK